MYVIVQYEDINNIDRESCLHIFRMFKLGKKILQKISKEIF